MERPDHKSLSSLLEKHPLPWKIVTLPIGSIKYDESDVMDANDEPVMRIKTKASDHQAVVDLISCMLPKLTA